MTKFLYEFQSKVSVVCELILYSSNATDATAQIANIIDLMEMCQLISSVSIVVAAYVPQPAVTWLSRAPKRRRADHAVLQCRGQQVEAHYLSLSMTQPRHPDNFNVTVFIVPFLLYFYIVPFIAYGRDLTAHSWLSMRLEQRTTNWSELNWTDLTNWIMHRLFSDNR